jgi:hypothetical protein
LDREIRNGNERASLYPRNRYVFTDVRTINWDKLIVTSGAYQGLTLFFGEETIDRLPRPYMSEEPALMVLGASFGTKGVLLLTFVGLRRRRAPDRAHLHI